MKFAVLRGTLLSIHALEIPVLILNIECVNPLSIGTPISTAILLVTLSIGTPISTLLNGHSKKPKDVSIPYLSGHPFLLKADEVIENIEDVSIPYLSGHPFLPREKSLFARFRDWLCQSPIYRDTHFYPPPQNCLILCGLPASILQVFIRQF